MDTESFKGHTPGPWHQVDNRFYRTRHRDSYSEDPSNLSYRSDRSGWLLSVVVAVVTIGGLCLLWQFADSVVLETLRQLQP